MNFHGIGAHGLAFYTVEQFLIFWMHCREALGRILARGHSRVPVYAGNPRNIVGLLLVRQLILKIFDNCKYCVLFWNRNEQKFVEFEALN